MCVNLQRPQPSTLFPYTTLFRSAGYGTFNNNDYYILGAGAGYYIYDGLEAGVDGNAWLGSKPHLYEASQALPDRKSTRLNSGHANISSAVFCLKQKSIIVT